MLGVVCVNLPGFRGNIKNGYRGKQVCMYNQREKEKPTSGTTIESVGTAKRAAVVRLAAVGRARTFVRNLVWRSGVVLLFKYCVVCV